MAFKKIQFSIFRHFFPSPFFPPIFIQFYLVAIDSCSIFCELHDGMQKLEFSLRHSEVIGKTVEPTPKN